MIRVFIVDDHGVVRRGLKQVLSEAADLTVVGEAATANEARRLLPVACCDVVMLDLSLPDQPGLELLRQVKADRPQLPVLILTMHREDEYAIRALKAGAAGFLTKDAAPEELLAAIRKVARGGRYLTVGVAERIAGHFASEPGQPLNGSPTASRPCRRIPTPRDGERRLRRW